MTNAPPPAATNSDPSEPAGSAVPEQEVGATALSATPVPPPAGDASNRRRATRRWAVVAGGLAVVLAGVGVVLGPRVIESWVPGTTVGLTVAPPEPAEPPSPFAGTPAEHFAEGADGIVLPPAEAIDPFTAEEVAEALEQVKAALIAARLDPTMLIDHNPDPFLALLAADERIGLRMWFESGDASRLATQVSAGSRLAPFSPRVEGRISYRVTPPAPLDPPIVEIVTQFVWVYAFETDDRAGYLLAVVRDELEWEMKYGLPWTEDTQGLWVLLTATAHAWGVDCDAHKDGLLRPLPGTLAETGEDPMVMFDPESPLESDSGCSAPPLS